MDISMKISPLFIVILLFNSCSYPYYNASPKRITEYPKMEDPQEGSSILFKVRSLEKYPNYYMGFGSQTHEKLDSAIYFSRFKAQADLILSIKLSFRCLQTIISNSTYTTQEMTEVISEYKSEFTIIYSDVSIRKIKYKVIDKQLDQNKHYSIKTIAFVKKSIYINDLILKGNVIFFDEKQTIIDSIEEIMNTKKYIELYYNEIKKYN